MTIPPLHRAQATPPTLQTKSQTSPISLAMRGLYHTPAPSIILFG